VGAIGLAGAAVVVVWARGASWGDDILIPVFAFVVTALTMDCAITAATPTLPGRWRVGATLTFGMLVQTAFIFLYFVRTGSLELYLVPLAVLCLAALSGPHSVTATLPARSMLLRATAVAAIAVLLTMSWLFVDEPGTSTTSASPADLTVMTYNIQEGFSNENIWSLEETARIIEAYDPDIVLLQEITRGWLVMSSVDQVRWLAERLDMDYAYSGNSDDELWGNAILTRLPILATDWVIFSTTDNLKRGAVAVDIETTGGSLRVLDTHLDNPRGATNVRLEQIDELLGLLGDSSPAIIAGDFNADPGSVEWQALIDAGLTDAAGNDATTTSEDARRIDYIFVTPDLAISSYNVPETWISDHRPVVVELTLLP